MISSPSISDYFDYRVANEIFFLFVELKNSKVSLFLYLYTQTSLVKDRNSFRKQKSCSIISNFVHHLHKTFVICFFSFPFSFQAFPPSLTADIMNRNSIGLIGCQPCFVLLLLSVCLLMLSLILSPPTLYILVYQCYELGAPYFFRILMSSLYSHCAVCLHQNL